MLRVLGSNRKLCNGIGRRDFLQAGSLGVAGLGVSDLLVAEAQATNEVVDRSFGRAKHCILLFLYGSPSQLETCGVDPAIACGSDGTFDHHI